MNVQEQNKKDLETVQQIKALLGKLSPGLSHVITPYAHGKILGKVHQWELDLKEHLSY